MKFGGQARTPLLEQSSVVPRTDWLGRTQAVRRESHERNPASKSPSRLAPCPALDRSFALSTLTTGEIIRRTVNLRFLLEDWAWYLKIIWSCSLRECLYKILNGRGWNIRTRTWKLICGSYFWENIWRAWNGTCDWDGRRCKRRVTWWTYGSHAPIPYVVVMK